MGAGQQAIGMEVSLFEEWLQAAEEKLLEDGGEATRWARHRLQHLLRYIIGTIMLLHGLVHALLSFVI